MFDIIPAILNHFKDSSPTKLIFEIILVGMLVIIVALVMKWITWESLVPVAYILGPIGIVALLASGTVQFNNPFKKEPRHHRHVEDDPDPEPEHRHREEIHTVEDSFSQSDFITSILNGERYKFGCEVLTHLRFSNGVTSLDGSFNFIRFSISEFSAAPHLSVNVQEYQYIPISINLALVSAMVKNELYCKDVDYTSPMYRQFTQMNIKSYCAYPVRNKHGMLTGFLFAGSSNKDKLPSTDDLVRIAGMIG